MSFITNVIFTYSDQIKLTREEGKILKNLKMVQRGNEMEINVREFLNSPTHATFKIILKHFSLKEYVNKYDQKINMVHAETCHFR